MFKYKVSALFPAHREVTELDWKGTDEFLMLLHNVFIVAPMSTATVVDVQQRTARGDEDKPSTMEFKARVLFSTRKQVSELDWMSGDELMAFLKSAVNGEWRAGAVTVLGVEPRLRTVEV